ncbi:29606_t:CDS:2 [Gigaspora margarita]|uniref:29606_t:CDS:1 n=1 Tax=Gigaspora margarita TaxID=4874 RepID=A0ABN7U975_GIGMA|nr:29606_t:CDS:2 [Gigaspora margarita]
MNNDNFLANRPDKSSHKLWIMKKLKECNLSLVLKNNSSVARDHLANERTFLACLRISLAFISIEATTEHLFVLTEGEPKSQKDNKITKGLGLAFIVLGIIFLGFSLIRYFNSQQLMTQNHFPNNSRVIVMIGSVFTFLTILAGFFVAIIMRYHVE